MPESLKHIQTRAKRLHYSRNQIVHGKKGYYLAPRGIKSRGAKLAYAHSRDAGHTKEYSAKVAWTVERKN